MKLRLLVLSVCLLSLTSCFDVFETFTINPDGSGIYEQKMDMTRLLSFATMMKGTANTGREPQKKDTTISFKSFVDTATAFTAAEKAALNKAEFKLHVDEASGEMNFTIVYPFASHNEFDIIQTVMAKEKTQQSIKAAMGNMFGKEGQGMDNLAQQKQPEMPTSAFTYKMTGNSLSKTVKESSKPESEAPKVDGMPPEFKEMMKMSFTTTVNLPREARKWEGNNGVLSADKKQLKFKKEIDMDTKLTPADFNFSVEY